MVYRLGMSLRLLFWGLYNASGKGQAVDSEVLSKIQSIDKTISLKILVSLSCTMCPELVTSAQKIATLNPNNTRSSVYKQFCRPQRAL